MVKRRISIAFAVLCLIIAVGVGWLWVGSYDGNSFAYTPLRFGHAAASYDPSAGGWISTTIFGSDEGGFFLFRAVETLSSKPHMLANATTTLSAQGLADFNEQVAQQVAYFQTVNGWRARIIGSKVHANFDYSGVLLDLDDYYPPNWKYGGFDFGLAHDMPSWWASSAATRWVVVPDWFIVCLALIWPAYVLPFPFYWRAARRLLAGRCPHCGGEKIAFRTCPECGIGPGWIGKRVQRLEPFAFVLWWIVPLFLAVLAMAWTVASPSLGFGWPEVFIGLALLYMLGVLIIRAFARILPVAEPPRGFAIVVKPAARDKNPNPGR